MDSGISILNYIGKAYLSTESNMITAVGDSFLEMTGYEKKDLVNTSIFNAFSSILRGTFEISDLGSKSEVAGYIFTRNFEAREVVVSLFQCSSENEKIYLVNEKPNIRLEKQYEYVEQLCRDNVVGVAIHSMPDLLLLKANKAYMAFQDAPFDDIRVSIGKPIHKRVNGFRGSKAERAFEEIIKTGGPCYPCEFKYDHFKGGTRYLDASLVSIAVDGKPRYIFETVCEVTEHVKNKQLVQKLSKDVLEKQRQLDSIIENMSEAFATCDKYGNLIYKNAEARKLYPDLAYCNTVAEFIRNYSFCDLNGNKIPENELPVYRSLRGVRIKNEIILIKRQDNAQVTMINSSPIFDEEGNVAFVATFHHDISAAYENETLIKRQQEKMLQIEKEKNDALVKAMEIKDEFLSLISHEFKTPLTIIHSATQAMQFICKDELSLKSKEFINKIQISCNRQLKLVNNLLDITRINSGQIRMSKRDMDIVWLTESITDSIKIYAEQKGIRLTFSSDLERQVLRIDEEKYERILLNLLSNAIKFTPKGEAVSVKISKVHVEGQDRIEIQVKDRGIGIPQDKHELIFERFGQVDNTLSRQAEGSGIGLTLVKKFVELLGGEISLKSDVGRGSTFSVTLPIGEAIDNPIEQEMNPWPDNKLIQATVIEFSDVYTN